MKIFITGINGFIGANLTRLILAKTDWEVIGFDISDANMGDMLDSPKLRFIKGDCFNSRDAIRAEIKNCDVILPLVAIANPLVYVERPLDVFKLDFEENLKIVYDCIEFKKRIVFPSTSEVYGMSDDIPFDEENSNLTTGPICKERWIYSTSKQLMDRVIYAAGKHEGLSFTLFRPFNFVGPLQDKPFNRGKANRALPTFISKVLHGEDITLVDGGEQKRCFVYIEDAMEALLKIIENKEGKADGKIYNIGSTDDEHNIKEIVEMVLSSAEKISGYEDVRTHVNVVSQDSGQYYGEGYQDVQRRVPSVEKIKNELDWKPTTSTADAIEKTVRFYLENVAPAIGHIPFSK